MDPRLPLSPTRSEPSLDGPVSTYTRNPRCRSAYVRNDHRRRQDSATHGTEPGGTESTPKGLLADDLGATSRDPNAYSPFRVRIEIWCPPGAYPAVY